MAALIDEISDGRIVWTSRRIELPDERPTSTPSFGVNIAIRQFENSEAESVEITIPIEAATQTDSALEVSLSGLVQFRVERRTLIPETELIDMLLDWAIDYSVGVLNAGLSDLTASVQHPRGDTYTIQIPVGIAQEIKQAAVDKPAVFFEE
ncbi:hypothetical protein [Gordonia soli]|uniref:Uncharacterized protein n=1 Tax=Gordonia soli NBRC 108243 TaxID=1223545 RepID=M0QSA3_9ACTN|nr:hypothetical protein [Gordonia soli]GAC71097.1 hypothetical protein GS4_51_00350 [Gordonia soli NBRC 108243]